MKNFDEWNEIKKKVDTYVGKRYHPKEIWWCFWGLNVGFEENGTSKYFQRPVVVLKTLSQNTCVVLPLTTSKDENKNRIYIGVIDNKHARVILSQIKVIDTRRLTEKIFTLNNDIFTQIRKAVRSMF